MQSLVATAISNRPPMPSGIGTSNIVCPFSSVFATIILSEKRDYYEILGYSDAIRDLQNRKRQKENHKKFCKWYRKSKRNTQDQRKMMKELD
jgi:hypothetical protein